MRRPSRWLHVALLVALPAAARAQAEGGHAHDGPREPATRARLGTVSFPASAPKAAHERFVQGVLYLHSFEYESAQAAFRDAQRLAPTFALAYWGEAQTFNHPVWNQNQPDSARAVLARLAPTREGRRLKAGTVREQEWLNTVEVLYGDGSKARRDTLYLEAMRRLVARYPADDEAKAFLALAWLGLNQGERRVSDYMRAGAIALDLFQRQPDHPGAAHFVIHAFDDPEHAVLGLPAARAYSRIAPGAAHAQHMTTHIFLALGMWKENNTQNTVAFDASKGLSGHYVEWLVYGKVQEGRYREAQQLLDSVRARVPVRPRGLGDTEPYLHAVVAVATRRWPTVADSALLRAPLMTWAPTVVNPWLYAWGASERNDAASLARGLARLRAVRDSIAGAARATGADKAMADVLTQMVEAADQAQRGDTARAIATLERAQATIDQLPVDFGPPVTPVLVGEQLGTLLLAARRPADAQRVAEAALKRCPGRSRTLALLLRAATAAGDAAVAGQARAALAHNWANADDGGLALRDLP